MKALALLALIATPAAAVLWAMLAASRRQVRDLCDELREAEADRGVVVGFPQHTPWVWPDGGAS